MDRDIISTLNDEKIYHQKIINDIDIVLRAIKRSDKIKLNIHRQDVSRQYRHQLKNKMNGKCYCGNELNGKYKTCPNCRKRAREYYCKHLKDADK